jgi:hypothetical protein
MQRFEVMFSIYRCNEFGKAAIGSSLTTNLKTVIDAPNQSQAKAMIEGQYGKNCSVHSVRPL